MTRWWQRRPRSDDAAVDSWVRRALQVEVPEGSFERVWSAARAAQQVPAPAWELELRLRRLRLWTRALAGGLALVSAVLLLVLLRQLPAPTTPAEQAETGAAAGALAALTRVGASAAADVEAGAYRRDDLLGDPRIVLRGVEAR